MSGFEPAPRPCVSFAPIWSLTGAGEACSAWMSVFATMNSTPVNSAAIIRLTALLPPPPRPMTLIFAACGTSSSSKSGRRVRSLSIRSSFRCLPAAALRRRPGERVPSDGNSGGCSPRPVLKDVLQPTGQAPREPSEPAPVRPRGGPRGRRRPPVPLLRAPARGKGGGGGEGVVVKMGAAPGGGDARGRVRAVGEGRRAGRPPADVPHDDAELLLVLVQHRLGRG